MTREIIVVEYIRIVTQTHLAWLLETTEGNIWFPKSECTIDEDNQVLELPEWLAYEKGVI